jgi:hypothetical protein
MKITFILVTNEGHAGDFHYDWQCPLVPRIGEGVSIENIFDEGKFVVSNDDHIESKIDESIESYVKGMLWKVTGMTWCKKEEYFLLVSLKGE